jgi:hypothetical protein
MENVDEGLLLMTGMEPGEKAPDGVYPKGSINRIIAENLKKISSISLDKD